MRPGLATILEKLRSSWNFDSPETDLSIAANACCIDYADTRLLKRIHWLSKSQCTNCSTTYYGCENTVGFDTAVHWASLSIPGIHLQVAEGSTISWFWATVDNTSWMEHRQVRHPRLKAIAILNPVDVKEAYGYSASWYHCLQWFVRLHGWGYVSFS